MKAEDTVLSDEKICEIVALNQDVSPYVMAYTSALAQTNPSFKAGIKEVVDFMKKNYWMAVLGEPWESKLKEWDV